VTERTWLFIFVCGCVNQGACAMWIHYAEANNVVGVGVMGMVEAITLLFGVDEALVKRQWQCALAWVLGYGLGPAIVVWARGM
jgi:hypothetical protein